MRSSLVATALAATTLPGCVGGALTLYEENDALSVRGRQDGYYTQGFRATRVFRRRDTPEVAKEIASWLPLYEDATTAIGIVGGQNIYTPKDIERGPDPDDRPYAGWLYGGIVISNRVLGDERSHDMQETLEVDLGVTGPPSLARQTQTLMHRWTGAQRPRGWSEQLHFEPGAVAVYENRHRVSYGELLGLEYDVLPSYGASLGNVDTHVGAGTTFRFGYELPRDFGVNTISTTAMESSRTDIGGFNAYVFAGGEERAVFHNLFLDGNTFRDSASVDRRIGVAEFKGGFAITWDCLRFTYTWITRSPEFHGQRNWTRYGSVSLGLFLDF
jgi:lipid A 3-O-deacylase